LNLLRSRAERVFERGLSRRSDLPRRNPMKTGAQADDWMISMMPIFGKMFSAPTSPQCEPLRWLK
jgi:hypothetical protein